MYQQPEEVVRFDVAYPERLSRLLIFVKWLLIIPHLVVMSLLLIVLGFVTFIAWFAILITGNYPQGLWDLSYWIMRWNMRVSIYTGLLRDEYPPFGEQPYPMLLELRYPDRLSRWKIFVKWILIIPHLIALWFLGILQSIITFIAWWAILFTGNYPQGLFAMTVGIMRWQLRVSVYELLMIDAYPPFALA